MEIANPVLQCVQIKPLAPRQPNGPERYRVVFSDVRNFVQSMLATRMYNSALLSDQDQV